MHNPWERHLRLALVLAAAALALGEFANVFLGAALAAMAFFVAMRPLFRNDLALPVPAA